MAPALGVRFVRSRKHCECRKECAIVLGSCSFFGKAGRKAEAL